MLTGSASHGIARRLRHHGYRVIGVESFVVDGAEGPLAEGELDRAREWAAGLAGALPFLFQTFSGTISIAPQGHSCAHRPQPLQKS
jgi:hypothetical protein